MYYLSVPFGGFGFGGGGGFFAPGKTYFVSGIGFLIPLLGSFFVVMTII